MTNKSAKLSGINIESKHSGRIEEESKNRYNGSYIQLRESRLEKKSFISISSKKKSIRRHKYDVNPFNCQEGASTKRKLLKSHDSVGCFEHQLEKKIKYKNKNVFIIENEMMKNKKNREFETPNIGNHYFIKEQFYNSEFLNRCVPNNHIRRINTDINISNEKLASVDDVRDRIDSKESYCTSTKILKHCVHTSQGQLKDRSKLHTSVDSFNHDQRQIRYRKKYNFRNELVSGHCDPNKALNYYNRDNQRLLFKYKQSGYKRSSCENDYRSDLRYCFHCCKSVRSDTKLSFNSLGSRFEGTTSSLHEHHCYTHDRKKHAKNRNRYKSRYLNRMSTTKFLSRSRSNDKSVVFKILSSDRSQCNNMYTIYGDDYDDYTRTKNHIFTHNNIGIESILPKLKSKNHRYPSSSRRVITLDSKKRDFRKTKQKISKKYKYQCRYQECSKYRYQEMRYKERRLEREQRRKHRQISRRCGHGGSKSRSGFETSTITATVSGSSRIRDDSYGHFEGGPGTVIADRYKVVKDVGMGTFGRVVEAIDLIHASINSRQQESSWGHLDFQYSQHNSNVVALKIVRSVKRYHESALIEADIVGDVNKRGGRGRSLCSILLNRFDLPCGHYCLVFECLGRSLYDFLKEHDYRPFPLYCVRDFATQLLDALDFLHGFGLIHTDLKPENILLTSNDEVTYQSWDGTVQQVPASTNIKVIDFGGATYDHEKKSSVVNTRQYRAPEVILGLGWSMPSDLWSVGCIVAELYMGNLLFATHDNVEHLALIEKIVGKFPIELLQRSETFGFSPSSSAIFDSYGWHKMDTVLSWTHASHVRKVVIIESIVANRDRSSGLVELLRCLLVIDPAIRATAGKALNARFCSQVC